MKSVKYFLLLASFIYGIISCDVIDEPFTKGDVGQPTLDPNRPNILLEEFTGHTCIYCPGGSEIAENLHKQYPDRIFIVAIHAGELAKPQAGEKYNYDFRTNEGNDIDNFYQASAQGLPRGMVNRIPYNNQKSYSPGNWINAIMDFWTKNNSRQLDIELSAEYDTNAKVITANVNLNYFIAQSKQNKLSVWILEDDIIKGQKSNKPPFDIPDYQHNNVLRYSFNGTWGEEINPVELNFSKNYTLSVSSEKDWNPNNLRLIAFVYDDDNGVKQVMDTKIKIKE